MSSLSMICLFRVPGAGLSRNASDTRKIYKISHFIKTTVNGGATTKLMILWSSTILKGSNYQKGCIKFTSYIILITSNYDCNMLPGKGTEPNKRRLDLHIIKLESYVSQIIKGYGYERDKK